MMPQIEPGKSVEELYWDRVRAMSPTEKLRKACRMTANVRAMVETQIREKQPDIDERTLKFAVARRMYWNEPNILKMLDDAEKLKMEGSDE